MGYSHFSGVSRKEYEEHTESDQSVQCLVFYLCYWLVADAKNICKNRVSVLSKIYLFYSRNMYLGDFLSLRLCISLWEFCSFLSLCLFLFCYSLIAFWLKQVSLLNYVHGKNVSLFVSNLLAERCWVMKTEEKKTEWSNGKKNKIIFPMFLILHLIS